ncbi:protein SQS1-like [Lycium barbarum]|uniref:protein SQS1-like n=1 Tax=Lycium barbarum TaxID=112863 RepID=UPI00293F4419|nr:protein SQS1-like [Lycium barbarum]
MENQGEQETWTLGETVVMLRDKVLQMEKHLQEIGRKIKEVERLLEMVGKGVPQEQYYGNVPEEVKESDPQEESEPQQEASEPIEEEELEEGEEEPQDIEEEELEPVNIEVEQEEEPFEMFLDFVEEEKAMNEESDYYALTNGGSNFYAPSPILAPASSNMEYEDYDELTIKPEGLVEELEELEDKRKPNMDETEVINFGDEEDVKETRIGGHLGALQKEELIALLKEYMDVFAWTYADMPGLST